MCRLFGFRSVIHSQVHSSLISADNALLNQGFKNPDGWGVAYYIYNTPHIIKSTQSAVDDSLFKKVSGIVSSQTVLAHLRKATQGSLSSLNTHPFQHGHWVFAHNGNIKNFNDIQDQIISLTHKEFLKFKLGDTDSESLFYYLLSQISNEVDLNSNHPVDTYIKILNNAITKLCSIIGKISLHGQANPNENFLTFILTNGKVMIGHQGGQSLHLSTYKKQCPERDTCSYFEPQCEKEVHTKKVNHLIFSSEPLSGENVWKEMKPGEIIGVDERMVLTKGKIKLPLNR